MRRWLRRAGWLFAVLGGTVTAAVLVLVAVGEYGRAVILMFAIYGCGTAASGLLTLADSPVTFRASKGAE